MENSAETRPGVGGVASLGSKTIGTFGGIMLLINNLAGPTVTLMPSLTQEAGWLAMVSTQVIIAGVSAACGFMLLAAVRAIPGNEGFALRVEYTDLVQHYMPRPWSSLVMVTYYAYMIMTLMTYIIQTAQVMDYVAMDWFGCAYGLELWPAPGVACGADAQSSTPFGSSSVLSCSFLVVAVACAPFALKNLDDNITLQCIAIIGFSIMVVVWLVLLVRMPDFPTDVPVASGAQRNLVSTLLFQFAFMSALPSWANEKKPQVSIGRSFATTMTYVVVVYSTIGIIGGMAFAPYFDTDQNLFSKLNASGSQLARFTVTAYPILQNFTSIPVFSIMIRYNLLQSGLFSGWSATAVAVGFPWLLSIPFYTGKGFDTIAEVGGIVTSSVINFAVPVILYMLSQRSKASPALLTQNVAVLTPKGEP